MKNCLHLFFLKKPTVASKTKTFVKKKTSSGRVDLKLFKYWSPVEGLDNNQWIINRLARKANTFVKASPGSGDASLYNVWTPGAEIGHKVGKVADFF